MFNRATHLSARAHVEEPAGGVVGARAEALAVWEQRHAVDVRLVSAQSHGALA